MATIFQKHQPAAPHRLGGTGRPVFVLDRFTAGMRAYCSVLIPYTEIEMRGARNGRKAHLQAVLETKLEAAAVRGEHRDHANKS